MRLIKISERQYINVDMITDVYIGDDHTIIRFAAPDFNADYAERPTQPHRIEVTGEAEKRFRRWLALNSEAVARRYRDEKQPAETI